MSITATTTITAPDPAIKFTTVGNLATLFNSLIATTIPGDLTPYILGSAVPGVEDQDKVWHRTDAAGRYIGAYIFYSGFWVLPKAPPGGRIGLFTGDPTVYFDGTGLGMSGPGPVAMDYWGWALNNGQNGTANLSDQFIICARVDNSGITGYNAGTGLWQSNVTGAALTQGGSATITTDATTTYRPAKPAAQATHWTASGASVDDGNGLWGNISLIDGTPFDIVPADPGNPTPLPITTVPPFYAVAYISYVGIP